MKTTERPEATHVAVAVAAFLAESGAADVVALGIAAQSTIADAFVIATVASAAQMRGLYRRVFDVLDENDRRSRQSQKRSEESGWVLLDCDDLVIHLMLAEQRSFYDLENLWYDAKVLADYRSDVAGASS